LSAGEWGIQSGSEAGRQPWKYCTSLGGNGFHGEFLRRLSLGRARALSVHLDLLLDYIEIVTP
jgi:hypothetical protein